MEKGTVVYFSTWVDDPDRTISRYTPYRKRIWHKATFIMWGVDTDEGMGSFTAGLVRYNGEFSLHHPSYLKFELGAKDELSNP